MEADFEPLFNRALDATYSPGSTYKMSTLITAIDKGPFTAAQEIQDTGWFEVGGMYLYCSTYTSTDGATDGMVNAAKGLTVSCNVYFYNLADNIAIDDMDETARMLGLGEPTGIELPEEIGYRANPETMKILYDGEDEEWYQGDKIQAGIGQSENYFTPLQLCVYTATLANRGTRYSATLLNRVVSADYRELVMENKPEILSTMEISDEVYEAILEGMNGVINNRDGTAWDTFNNSPYFDVNPCPYIDIIAAKTGTTEHGGGGSDHGSFIAFAPMDDPEIAVAVYGEKVGHGYAMAKVVRTILEYYFSMDEVGYVSDVQIMENWPG